MVRRNKKEEKSKSPHLRYIDIYICMSQIQNLNGQKSPFVVPNELFKYKAGCGHSSSAMKDRGGEVIAHLTRALG